MASKQTLAKLTKELDTAQKNVLSLVGAITDDSSFIETDRFIGADTELGTACGEGVICGFANINENKVAIFSTNSAVLKGAIGKRNSDKIVKLINNAVKAGIPLIGVLDTQGGRLAEGIEALEGYASITRAFNVASRNIPTIIVNKGKNYGITSYLSAMCDFCIGYEKSEVSSASPLIISANAGVSENKTGTASIHKKETGIFSAVVKTDADLKNCIIKYLDIISIDTIECTDDLNRVSKTLKAGVKTKELIKEIFDTDSFVDYCGEFCPEVVTGFARLGGMATAVLVFDTKADGVKLDSKNASKILEFFKRAESFGMPIVSLVNCTGTVVDINEENTTLIKNVADLLVGANSLSVPKIALITGSAVGVGYTAFASKSVNDYVLAWQTSRIAMVDSIKMAELLYAEEIKKSKNQDAILKKLSTSYADENQTALALAKDGYFDNIIEPAFSRSYLISAVSMYRDMD